jgi:hypothetical protein
MATPELTDESFGRNYDTMGKGGRNADDINNKFSRDRRSMKRWTNRLCRPTRPFSAWETTEISGNFGIRNGEDTVGDINTKFSERQKEYERMSIPPVTPSNQSIFNISKNRNERTAGLICGTKKKSREREWRQRVSSHPDAENIKHREGALLIQILWILYIK